MSKAHTDKAKELLVNAIRKATYENPYQPESNIGVVNTVSDLKYILAVLKSATKED